MPVDKDRIYRSASSSVAFECLLLVTARSSTCYQSINEYQPIVPIRATGWVMDILEEVFLEIGGRSETTAFAQIDGNVVSATLPGEYTNVAQATDYKMFITAEFANGVTKTHPVLFSVLEFR